MKSTPADTQTALRAHRTKQVQQSRVLNILAVETDMGFQLSNPRVPDVHVILAGMYTEPNDALFLLPFNQFLDFIDAHEWHKKGIDIPQPGGRIHVPFGVFLPLRGGYLDLIAQVLLNPHIQTVFDIGTGSGVITAILAERGISEVTAIDTNPKIIACATTDFACLGLDKQVAVQAVDLFPEGRADLIVCDPSWLPAKPTPVVETVLYDPDNAMLIALLNGAWQHLDPQGEAWLIISNLAEHLRLRDRDSLGQCLWTASLSVVGILEAKPRHRKAVDEPGPLVFARNREITRPYRLEAVR